MTIGGEDYALCDVAPPPFGDGIVEAQDLIFLSEYLFEDYRLTAHWKLDEAEGTVALDSAADYAGTVYGNPTWRPADGKVNGALQFDGIDDHISVPFVLNPADAPFSIFAWIKGGALGQVVISQTGIPWGANWLRAGPSDGSLMTELKGTGRWDRPLASTSIITDGSWHYVGLVRDGSNRTLYVDDVAVATDTQNDLGSTNGGLYIGAGRILDPGSFFSGLIDDVRIYNRAIIP